MRDGLYLDGVDYLVALDNQLEKCLITYSGRDVLEWDYLSLSEHTPNPNPKSAYKSLLIPKEYLL